MLQHRPDATKQQNPAQRISRQGFQQAWRIAHHNEQQTRRQQPDTLKIPRSMGRKMRTDTTPSTACPRSGRCAGDNAAMTRSALGPRYPMNGIEGPAAAMVSTRPSRSRRTYFDQVAEARPHETWRPRGQRGRRAGPGPEALTGPPRPGPPDLQDATAPRATLPLRDVSAGRVAMAAPSRSFARAFFMIFTTSARRNTPPHVTWYTDLIITRPGGGPSLTWTRGLRHPDGLGRPQALNRVAVIEVINDTVPKFHAK